MKHLRNTMALAIEAGKNSENGYKIHHYEHVMQGYLHLEVGVSVVKPILVKATELVSWAILHHTYFFLCCFWGTLVGSVSPNTQRNSCKARLLLIYYENTGIACLVYFTCSPPEKTI